MVAHLLNLHQKGLQNGTFLEIPTSDKKAKQQTVCHVCQAKEAKKNSYTGA
jgi:hypothetical protein